MQFFYRKIPKQKRSKDEKILTKFHCYMIFYPTSPFYFYLSCCTWLAVGIMQGSLTFLAAIYIFLLLFTSFFLSVSLSEKNKNVYICILSKLKLKITSFNHVFIFLLNFFSMCLRFMNTFLVRWFHGRFSAKNYRRSIQFHLV